MDHLRPQFADAIAQEKDLADRGTPVLGQLALAALIQSGRYDRHLRRVRAIYAHRHQHWPKRSAGMRPAWS